MRAAARPAVVPDPDRHYTRPAAVRARTGAIVDPTTDPTGGDA